MIIHVKGDVIELTGSLVENHWPALRSVVSLLLEKHPSGAIVDGSGLTEINEAGAHTFLEASNFIEAHHARVVVANLPAHIVEQIRQIPGARSQLPLAASIEEARASLAVGGIEAIPETQRKPAVLVPILGAWQRAVDFAAIQAARKAEIHLLYVIEIPRAQPLGIPYPEKEREATEVLAEAEKALGRSGLTVRKLTTRARVASEGIGKYVEEARPRLVVVAYPKSELAVEVRTHDIGGILCHDGPGDAAFFYVEDLTGPPESRNPIVLVLLIGAWLTALDYAVVQAAAKGAELHLLYPIQVPRTLTLETPLPDAEKAAQQTLAEAESALDRSRRVVVRKHIIRVRDVLEGSAKFAAEIKPELLMTAYLKQDLSDEGRRHNIAATLSHESAAADVAIFCVTE